MCVISDNSSILGLGGIIGGTKTSTEFDTKDILLESAYFQPAFIRKTARELNIETDAKYRVERGIDPLAFRYLCMTARYRTRINFTFTSLKACETALNKLRRHYILFRKDSDKLIPENDKIEEWHTRFINKVCVNISREGDRVMPSGIMNIFRRRNYIKITTYDYIFIFFRQRF